MVLLIHEHGSLMDEGDTHSTPYPSSHFFCKMLRDDCHHCALDGSSTHPRLLLPHLRLVVWFFFLPRPPAYRAQNPAYSCYNHSSQGAVPLRVSHKTFPCPAVGTHKSQMCCTVCVNQQTLPQYTVQACVECAPCRGGGGVTTSHVEPVAL